MKEVMILEIHVKRQGQIYQRLSGKCNNRNSGKSQNVGAEGLQRPGRQN